MRNTGTHRLLGFASCAIAALLLAGVTPPAFSDTIFLKDGQTITTDRYWEDGDSISFAVDNLIASVPREEVERIEPVPAGPSPAADVQSPPDATPPGKIPNTCPASSRPSTKPTKPLGSAGCSGIAAVQDIHGLESIGTDPAFGGIDKYANPRDALKFGTAPVEKIEYSFWQDNLLSVTLWVQGQAHYESLREEAFKRFGKGLQGDDRVERYVWTGGPSDKYLEYDATIDQGLLWFRNRSLWQRLASTD